MYSEEYERNDHMNNSDGSEQVIEFAMLFWCSNEIGKNMLPLFLTIRTFISGPRNDCDEICTIVYFEKEIERVNESWRLLC